MWLWRSLNWSSSGYGTHENGAVAVFRAAFISDVKNIIDPFVLIHPKIGSSRTSSTTDDRRMSKNES